MARKPASQSPVLPGPPTLSMNAATVSSAAVAHGKSAPLDTSVKAPTRARAVTHASASREYAVCDLCGEQLGRHAGHFHMVSPLTARHVSVCRTCRRAALSEGYRPRA